MTYPLEQKAAAIAMMIAGETLHHVSKVTGIPRSTLRKWWDQDIEPMLPRLLIPGFDFSGMRDELGGRQRKR